MNVNARSLLTLLEQRHADDVFVPECKDGPTLGGGHVRLDGWAMKRSWTKPLVIGYEIKVSRSDFLQDQKWPEYLPLCNQLYFVCPTGLIQPPEVPAEVGLLWAAKTGTRLFAKAKAAHRDVTIPESVWRYILMCRAKITRENEVRNHDRAFWEAWLEHKLVDERFGRMVGRAIGERVRNEILAVRAENERMQSLVARYDNLRTWLQSLGLDPDSKWDTTEWAVERRVQQAREAVPGDLLTGLDKLASLAAETREKLVQFNKEPAPTSSSAHE